MAYRPSDSVLLSWIEEEYDVATDETFASGCESDATTENSPHHTDTEQSNDSASDERANLPISEPPNPPILQCIPSRTTLQPSSQHRSQKRPPATATMQLSGIQYTGKDEHTNWAIRFDDKGTRNARKKIDNLASIRKVFESFVSSCNSSYTPGEYLTIDEKLEGFRGRCMFRQYISSKPDKYGIKIYAMVDARTFFTVNMEIYPGKQPAGCPYPTDNSAAAVVKRIFRPIDKSGRNITMDNYFTSVPLANDLYANHRTTIVGTIRKNKPQLPPEFLNVKERPVGSSMFGFGKEPNNTLLVSYVPKKNKNVLMLSTLHDDDTNDPETGDDNKPEVITFYNLTKGGVDVVDRKKKDYSVKRVNNRWPLVIFCGLLDLATVNAQIIYFSNTGDTIPRRKFITNLAMDLVKPHLLRRASVDVLSIGLRQSIKNVLGQDLPVRNERQETFGRKPRCAYCPVRKNRFTSVCCVESSAYGHLCVPYRVLLWAGVIPIDIPALRDR
ncbi:uncharacterized protein LOC124368236 [Homalodisca vitripennis]|uniref:uncharacterized protein LOC124368236 n=1 Tax=Homalodisca vitripennis TaxID=197043 RepID=UPI001EEC4B3C|nr:uncharacterized protein LOC124368236 [Homalodisca vitripennis]